MIITIIYNTTMNRLTIYIDVSTILLATRFSIIYKKFLLKYSITLLNRSNTL